MSSDIDHYNSNHNNLSNGNGAIQRVGALVPSDMMGWEGGGGPQPAHAGNGVSGYVNSLRRRWLVATAIGVVCGILAALGTWYFHAPKYMAFSYLEVWPTEKSGILAGNVKTNAADFTTYKSTQRELLRNYAVIQAALSDSEISKLPMVLLNDDSVEWAKRGIRVNFPGDGGIMEVTLAADGERTGKRSQDLMRVLDAIVDTYLREVVRSEQDELTGSLKNLGDIKHEQELRVTDLRRHLTDITGTALTGKSAQDLDQMRRMEEWQDALKRLRSTRYELTVAQVAARIQEKAQASAAQIKEEAQAKEDAGTAEAGGDSAVTQIEITEDDLNKWARSDPETSQLKGKMELVRKSIDHNVGIAPRSPITQGLRADAEAELAKLEAQVEDRRQVLRTVALEQRRLALAGSPTLTSERNIPALMELEKELQLQVDSLADAFPQPPDDDKAMQLSAELDAAVTTLNQLNSQLERAVLRQKSLDMQSTAAAGSDSYSSRVTRREKAFIPQTNPSASLWQYVAVAGGLGFVFPVILITWWDTRANRINSVEEVVGGLGLDVLGSIPYVPAREIRRLNDKSRHKRHWQAMMTESVDAVSASLIRKAEQESDQVILVSSAMPGEGKTTLAVQLARSLAVSGRRTVLVDFDLRRPSINGVFKMDLEPGVSDLLCDPELLPEVLKRDSRGELYVLTAGRWLSNPLSASTQEGIGELFNKLRADFEFVVVDCSPILPAVDTRLLVQHVDGVILSVLRDVSEAPKVVAACEVLQAFGARVIGAVVTGVDPPTYYRDTRYLIPTTNS